MHSVWLLGELLMWNGDGILRKGRALNSSPLPYRVEEGLRTKEITKRKSEAMDADSILYSIQYYMSSVFSSLYFPISLQTTLLSV
jgi:hypothetical protein